MADKIGDEVVNKVSVHRSHDIGLLRAAAGVLPHMRTSAEMCEPLDLLLYHRVVNVTNGTVNPMPSDNSHNTSTIDTSEPVPSQPSRERNESWRRQLACVSIFSGLTESALELVQRVATLEQFPAGKSIFKQGAHGEKLYLIIKGRVRISRTTQGMGEETLAILSPGDVFGEMALLDEAPRSADASAHEDCSLVSIPKDGFEDLLYLHKDLAYEVLWNVIQTLIRRLRTTNDKLTFLSMSDRF